MPKAKPYSGPVEENVARQLLNSTGCKVDINGETLLLGDALLAAAKQLEHLVEESNTQLEANPFAKIVAEHLATDLNRRGRAEIAVHDNGSVQLHVNYQGNPRTPKQKQKRKRKLPLMEELKARAEELGVEIPEEFGIKRSKIHEYLNQIAAGESSTPKKAKKLPKKLEVAEDPPEADPGPMSAGPDETKVSAPLDEAKIPKKRGFVKTSQAVSGPVVVTTSPPEDSNPTLEAEPLGSNGAKKSSETAPGTKKRSMRQLVEDSKEVDISNLLASEPPK